MVRSYIFYFVSAVTNQTANQKSVEKTEIIVKQQDIDTWNSLYKDDCFNPAYKIRPECCEISVNSCVQLKIDRWYFHKNTGGKETIHFKKPLVKNIDDENQE